MKNVHYINAGAGSGKTYTLTDKMSRLFLDGETSPSRVILTTFTELAAAEFKEKSRAMLISKGMFDKASQMDSAAIGTVHSLAFRYIQKYWYLLGLGANVQAMPEEQTQLFIEDSLSATASDEDVEFFNRYVELLNIKMTQSTRFHYDMWKEDLKNLVETSESFGVQKLDDSLAYSSDEIRDFLGDAGSIAEIKSKLAENGITPESDDFYRKLIYGYQERIFRLAMAWKQRFDEYKRTRNLVSFNDMEHLFIELLGKPEVQEDIHESIDYIFVDEFQDSNPTQIRIFDLLSELVGKGSFWVGDPKQAIYDFRGCDTELVSALTDFIEEKSKTPESGFTYSSLEYSWRSDAKLVELANKTFVPVFNNLSPDKVELKAKRNGDLPADVPHIYHWNMFAKNPDTGRRLSSGDNLADRVVARVVDILEGKHRIHLIKDKDTGELRKVRPNDIAILCRFNNECEALATRFRVLGVPVARDFQVTISNHQSMLVVSILNYFAENKAPDILKAELMALLKEKDFEEIVADREHLLSDKIFETLDALKESLQGQPVSTVIESIIHSLDLYHEVEKWGDGENRKRYLSALVAAAAQYEQQCKLGGRIATLSGFINFISVNEFTVGRDVQRDGVNILTYHGSKGLEWNVVILYSLGTSFLKDAQLMKHSYTGVNTIRKSRPSKENFYSEFLARFIPRFLSSTSSNLPAPMVEKIGLLDEYEDIREHERQQAARLLYVGLTRARDYLISVSATETKLDWLKELGIESKVQKDLPEGTAVQVWGAASPDASYEQITETKDGRLGADEDTFRMLPIIDEHPDYEPLYLVPSSAEMDLSSVRVQMVGNLTNGGRINLKDFGSRASEMGTCIHNVFEVFTPGDEEANLAAADRMVEQFGFSGVIPSEDILSSAKALFTHLKAHYGEAVSVLRELPFMMERDGQIIRGEIDLVWKTAQGCVLLDYKNYPGAKDICNPESSDYAGQFAPQLFIYMEALERAGEKVLDVLVYYPIQGDLVDLTL